MRSLSNQTIRRFEGFTVIELVTTIAIIGILSTIAASAILTWLPNMRLNGSARDLFGTIMMAKGEAVKRNMNCAIVFNQTIAGDTFAYVLFEDSNPAPATAARMAEFDIGEQIIRSQRQWPDEVGLDTTQGGGDGISFSNNTDGNPSIVFRPNSIPTDNNGGLANGSIFLINTNGRTRNVVVNMSGNVHIN